MSRQTFAQRADAGVQFGAESKSGRDLLQDRRGEDGKYISTDKMYFQYRVKLHLNPIEVPLNIVNCKKSLYFILLIY